MRLSFSLIALPPPNSTLFPYTTLFRSGLAVAVVVEQQADVATAGDHDLSFRIDRERLAVVGQVVAGELGDGEPRSEEHTSELQSHSDLVCRLLLEKKNLGVMNMRYCYK